MYRSLSVSIVAVTLAATVFILSLSLNPDTHFGESALSDDTVENGSENIIFEVGDSPRLPPNVTLDLSGRSSIADPEGKLAYYSWAFDDGARTNKPKPPIDWPKPVQVDADSNISVNLKTSATPQQLDVLLHAAIDRNGVPSEENLKPLTCTSDMLEGKVACEVEWSKDSEGNRVISFPARYCSEPCYIAIYASWMLQDEVMNADGTPVAENSASWLFTVSPIKE